MSADIAARRLGCAALEHPADRHKRRFCASTKRFLQRTGTDYAKVQHNNIDARQMDTFYGAGEWRRMTVENAQQLDLDGLRGRLLSSSYVPNLGEPGCDEMLAELENLFSKHAKQGRVSLDYLTEIYSGRLELLCSWAKAHATCEQPKSNAVAGHMHCLRGKAEFNHKHSDLIKRQSSVERFSKELLLMRILGAAYCRTRYSTMSWLSGRARSRIKSNPPARQTRTASRSTVIGSGMW